MARRPTDKTIFDLVPHVRADKGHKDEPALRPIPVRAERDRSGFFGYLGDRKGALIVPLLFVADDNPAKRMEYYCAALGDKAWPRVYRLVFGDGGVEGIDAGRAWAESIMQQRLPDGGSVPLWAQVWRARSVRRRERVDGVMVDAQPGLAVGRGGNDPATIGLDHLDACRDLAAELGRRLRDGVLVPERAR